MKKTALSLLAGTLIFAAVPFQAHAVTKNQKAEIVHSVNFRTAPSTSGKQIRYLKDGEIVTILSQPNSYWYEIKDQNGKVGYVSTSSKYIDVMEGSTNASSFHPNATIVYGVSFRTGPSTDNSRIRYLSKNEQVEILEQPNPYWYRVKDQNGATGYVSTSSKYIQTEYKPAGNGSTSFQPNATAVSSVSFRTGPSTNDSRIRYLKKNEDIMIISQVNDYWYQIVDVNGTKGYVSSLDKYIDTDYGKGLYGDSDPDFQDEPNAVVIYGVAFRTGPSTNDKRIRYLSKGESINILSKYNDYWYKAEDANGVIGYVSTSSKYIETSYKEPHQTIDKKEAIELVIKAGIKYLGTPYEFGSSRNNTATFDCSDFVRQAFLDALELRLPGDSRKQGAYVKELGNAKTNLSQMKRGDLLFFMSYQGNKATNYAKVDKSKERITHVAIYLGNGEILQTYSKESGGVRIDKIGNNSWEYRLLFGGSAL